jgi:hypothetical protein
MAREGDVRAIEPGGGIGAVLPGADFIDSYRVMVPKSGLDAEAIARLMFQHQPGWLAAMMHLRDGIVGPLGLKTARRAHEGPGPAIGYFPVVTATRERIVLGFPDWHLDFRVVVDVVRRGDDDGVTVTTLVRLNNLLGRVYLTSILPFHRMVVRATLKSLVARLIGLDQEP